MQPKGRKASLRETLSEKRRRLDRLFRTEIWKVSALAERTPRSLGLKLLQIISISFSGLKEIHIGSRAAALCFSSLLGIGPLIAVAFTIAGFVLERTDSDIAVRSVNQVITFIAPQLTIPETDEDASDDAPPVNGEGARDAVNPYIAELIDDFIERTRSGTVGLAGTLLIVLVAIQLLTSVENAFNDIWGVKRGRSIFHRIVFYWTLLSLGAVLAFAAMGLFSLTFTAFFEQLPLGKQLFGILQWLTPLFSLLVLVLLLASFYRFMPNTHVGWNAAACGGLIAAILLVLNNALTFLYVQRVVTTYNVYGSLGILPVFMLGLFVFWLIILFCAQITYAVQNVNYLSNQEIWKGISHSTRELLGLIVIMTVCRRFRNCEPPCSSEELTSLLKAPGHVVNECLSRLVEMNYLIAFTETDAHASQITRYQPARPLEKITLQGFREDFADFGNSEASLLLDDLEPAVKRFRAEIRHAEAGGTVRKSVFALLKEEDAAKKHREHKNH